MSFLHHGSPWAIATLALALSSLARDVLARPSPEPKVGWLRNGPGKKKMADHIKRAIEGQRRTAELPSCADSLTTTITAPKANPWGALTDTETAAVVEWLFAQEDLNLTTTENAGSWDNTVSVGIHRPRGELRLTRSQSPGRGDVAEQDRRPCLY